MQHWLQSDLTLRTGLLVVLGALLLSASCFGIVFWAWHGSVVGVLLSALLPGFGAIWMLARPWKANSTGLDQS